MRHDQVDHVALDHEQVRQVAHILESLVLVGYHLALVVEVENLRAELNLLQKVLLALLGLFVPVGTSRLALIRSRSHLFNYKSNPSNL